MIHPQPKISRRNKGYVLLSTIALLLVVTLGIGAVSLNASNSARMSTHRRDSEMAFNLAEAGFARSFQKLKKDPAFKGEVNTVLGGGTFSTTVKPAASGGTYYDISSVGNVVTSYNGVLVSRSVNGVVDVPDAPPYGEFAIISEKPISVNGSVKTSSFPTTGIGHIHSNTSIDMIGAPVVDGNATSVGQVVGGKVLGDRINNAPYIALPKVDAVQLLKEATAAGVHTGDINVSGNQTVTVSGVIVGNLSASSSGVVNVVGSVYVTGRVNLTSSSYGGDGLIVSAGDVSMSGGSGLSSGATNSLAIICLSSSPSAVSITGNSTVRGAIYAPQGGVSLSGNVTIHGSIAADSIHTNGSISVIKDTNFRWPSQSTPPKIKYWAE